MLDAQGKAKRRQLGSRCPKLRRKDGTWNPRHGKWYFAVSSRGLGGKRVQHPRGGFDSEAEALAELEKVKATIGRGVTPTGVRIGPWLPQWLDAKLDIRPNTRLSYCGHITNYLVPHLGHHRLDGLRAEHVAEMLAAVPGSDATRQRVRAALRGP